MRLHLCYHGPEKLKREKIIKQAEISSINELDGLFQIKLRINAVFTL